MAPRKMKKGIGGKAEKRSDSEFRRPGCPVVLDTGCLKGCEVDEDMPGNAVRMECTNEACPMSQLVHRECYDAWEDHLVKILASVSWARSWTEAQKRANLWDKKGYLLIQKLCRCLCGLGKVRRDLDYIPPALPNAPESEKPKKRTAKKQLPVLVSSERGRAPPPGLLSPRTPTTPGPVTRRQRTRSPNPTYTSESLENEWQKSRAGAEREAASRFVFSPKAVRALAPATTNVWFTKKEQNGMCDSPISPLRSDYAYNTEAEYFKAVVGVLLCGSAVEAADERLRRVERETEPSVLGALGSRDDEDSPLLDEMDKLESAGIGLYADSMGTHWLYLKSTHLCLDLPNGSSEDCSLNLPAAPLSETRAPPPPTDPCTQLYQGRVLNVCPRFGYVEVLELGCDVFFIPSQVVVYPSGRTLLKEAGVEGVAERLPRGLVVHLTVSHPDEKRGTGWVAEKVWVTESDVSEGRMSPAPVEEEMGAVGVGVQPPSAPNVPKSAEKNGERRWWSGEEEQRQYSLFDRGLCLGEALLASLDAIPNSPLRPRPQTTL